MPTGPMVGVEGRVRTGPVMVEERRVLQGSGRPCGGSSKKDYLKGVTGPVVGVEGRQGEAAGSGLLMQEIWSRSTMLSGVDTTTFKIQNRFCSQRWNPTLTANYNMTCTFIISLSNSIEKDQIILLICSSKQLFIIFYLFLLLRQCDGSDALWAHKLDSLETLIVEKH